MVFLISLLSPRKMHKMLNHKQNLLTMSIHVSNMKPRNLRDIQLWKRAVEAPIPANPNDLLDCLAAAEDNANEAQRTYNFLSIVFIAYEERFVETANDHTKTMILLRTKLMSSKKAFCWLEHTIKQIRTTPVQVSLRWNWSNEEELKQLRSNLVQEQVAVPVLLLLNNQYQLVWFHLKTAFSAEIWR